ncbi:MAG: hypothetical protein WD135_09685 [Ferruginibacter sp.]
MRLTIFSNWNFLRAVRLLIGLSILTQAVLAKDGLFGLLGILFTAMPLFNIGCCGINSCTTPVNKMNKKEIIYEEVV